MLSSYRSSLPVHQGDCWGILPVTLRWRLPTSERFFIFIPLFQSVNTLTSHVLRSLKRHSGVVVRVKTDAPERRGYVTERRCQSDKTIIRTLVTSDDFLPGLTWCCLQGRWPRRHLVFPSVVRKWRRTASNSTCTRKRPNFKWSYAVRTVIRSSCGKSENILRRRF